MAFRIRLSNELKNCTFTSGYSEMCDSAKKLDPVEEEMERHFLEIAKRKGLVESFSKKEYMTMEA